MKFRIVKSHGIYKVQKVQFNYWSDTYCWVDAMDFLYFNTYGQALSFIENLREDNSMDWKEVYSE